MTDKKNDNVPLLTIAIPTWNRANYLSLNLQQLKQEAGNQWDSVEVLISDNASTDDTQQIVMDAVAGGMPIRYIRNAENIGSDANIAQCFDLSLGDFVLIMGDDDLFVDGALGHLLQHLDVNTLGVACMRPYGFNSDFRLEQPNSTQKAVLFQEPGKFLATIGPLMTLISSCVVNRRLLGNLQAKSFCGDNLVQVHLVLRAALAAENNIFFRHYLIACKRNNSGGYDFSQVFVSNLCAAMDSAKPFGLSDQSIEEIEKHLMLAYYPFYLLRQRLAATGDLKATFARFEKRFHRYFLFYCWLAPTICLPRPFAIVWGGITTGIGRVLRGDLGRGFTFLCNKISQRRGSK
jgi:abequosyltransferase